MKRFLITSLLVSGIFLLRADEKSPIDIEDAKIRSRLTAKGFYCRENPVSGNGQRAEISIPMNNKTIYYVALVTGQGKTAARTKDLTLINQRKHTKKPEFQNTFFGSEVSIRPNSDGDKLLQFNMDRKADYRLTLCVVEATLYSTGDGLPALQEFGNF